MSGEMFSLCDVYFRLTSQTSVVSEAGTNSIVIDGNTQLYNQTCLKQPLKNRQNEGLKDRW